MRRMLLNSKGFTLVEILMVVIIVGLLASISTPLFLTQRNRALASEAVANMALIRQAMRDYWIIQNTHFDITSGNIKNALPTSVSSGVPTPSTAGVEIDVGVTQFFSNAAYSLDATSPSSSRFTNPGVVDFLIQVNGGASVACSSSVTTNCAINATRISNIDIEMDNSGRIFISYDNGTNWQKY